MSRDVTDIGGLVSEMAQGKRLRYEWSLDRAEKYYEFNLTGFSRMLAVARSNAACNR